MSDARTSTYRTPPSRTFLIAHAALTALGVACLFLPGKLTIRLVRLLPVAFTVRSGGTSLETFAVLGPSIIRRFGACLLLGVGLSTAWLVLPHTAVQRIAATCRRACSLPHTSPRTRALCRSVLLFAIPFAAFFWLSSPHNAFSANSRIHGSTTSRGDPMCSSTPAGESPTSCSTSTLRSGRASTPACLPSPSTP